MANELRRLRVRWRRVKTGCPGEENVLSPREVEADELLATVLFFLGGMILGGERAKDGEEGGVWKEGKVETGGRRRRQMKSPRHARSRPTRAWGKRGNFVESPFYGRCPFRNVLDSFEQEPSTW